MAELLLEKFKINNKCQLNSEDISSLTLLYLPLIGLDSFSLYCALCSINQETEHQFKELVNITNISPLSNLNNAFEKLEGIGLIKSFYHKEKGYLFELVSPLKEKEFVKEEVLISLLETQIGYTEVEKIKAKYKPVNKAYKNVSKKLSDVYTVTTKQTSEVINNLIAPTFVVENPDFNYSLFKMLFDSNFIDEEIFEDEELRNRIIKLSYVYKLTEEEMKDVFVKTINHDKRYDYPALSKNARSTFQKKYKVDAPKLVSKSEDNYIQSIQDDVTLKLCNELESMSPADVLESLSGMKATPSELKIAEDLLTNTKLSKGAVNFMLLYVSKEKDGELPSYNYFEKIAATWSRAKVKTALDAYKYMEKKKTEVKEPKTYKPGKKVAALPDWYTDYEKTLQENKSENKSEASDEIKQIAKNLFED